MPPMAIPPIIKAAHHDKYTISDKRTTLLKIPANNAPKAPMALHAEFGGLSISFRIVPRPLFN
jgi:hypothetical protein